MPTEKCRVCSAELEHVFVDLGMSPISNDYVAPEKANAMEPFYPLCVYVCDQCWLVQLPAVQSADDIFRDDYAYFSSVSKGWLDHARRYVDMMCERFDFGADSSVVELASNDGYLLQYFRKKNVPVLGIEPCGSVADAAEKIGVPTLREFFGRDLGRRIAAEQGSADLVIGNNVLAHVPDLMDFVAGIEQLLAADGVVTIEFPHLLKLIELNQFDTIYHEHFSYFSMLSVAGVFERHGLRIFDVEELPTHGGSLRIFGCHASSSAHEDTGAVDALLARERDAGIDDLALYEQFEVRVQATKRELLNFLIEAKNAGKRIVGYGAPAKGNTLLNYCGVRTDFIDFTVDRAPSKQGTLLPGTRIPVREPDAIFEAKPDYVLILPWNIKDEIIEQMSEIRRWGGRFVVPIPGVRVLD